MQCKKACLIVDLREGEHLAKITDLVAVLAAAGWNTDIAVKEYGGEAMKLATKAVKKGYDLIIGYGGDGTLNQVVNGVMNANGKGQSVVGAIPGGTANEWASETGLPLEAMQAALTLINSDARKVDLGHVSVKGLIFPGSTPGNAQSTAPSNGKKAKVPSKTKQRFLLMAGLGMDARVIAHISKSLKYRIGRLAFDVAAIKELPSQKPFPIEIRDGNGGLLLQGEAWQVIVANARRYGNVVDVAPNAHLDDGLLDLCVFTEGNVLSTMEQIASLLFQHKPNQRTAKFFRSPHFSIRVPASIGMHLDGSLTELKDYLDKSELDALAHAGSPEHIMVDYRFDAEPAALQIAIPRAYDGPLFEKQMTQKHSQATMQQHDQDNNRSEEPPELVSELLEHGTKVTVVGVAPNPAKKETYIIAGTTQNPNTGDTRPVAIRVNDHVTIVKRNGEHATSAAVQELQSGAEIVSDGKKSKRGAIRATRLVI